MYDEEEQKNRELIKFLKQVTGCLIKINPLQQEAPAVQSLCDPCLDEMQPVNLLCCAGLLIEQGYPWTN